jgi:hypothetical protein
MLNTLPCPDVKKGRKIGIEAAKTNPEALDLEGQFEVTINGRNAILKSKGRN